MFNFKSQCSGLRPALSCLFMFVSLAAPVTMISFSIAIVVMGRLSH